MIKQFADEVTCQQSSGIFLKMKPVLYPLLLLSPFLTSAQKKYQKAPDAPGIWNYTYLNEQKGGYRSDANYVLSPAELTTFKKKIIAVLETLHQNSITLKPIGFEATVSAGIWANMYRNNYDVKKLAGKIPMAEMIIRFCPIATELATGKIVKNCIEVEHCDVMLNNPDHNIKSVLNYTGDGYNKEINDAANKLREVFQAPEITKNLLKE